MKKALFIVFLLAVTSALNFSSGYNAGNNEKNCLEKYHTRTEEEMKELQELYDKEVTEKVNIEESEKVSNAIGLDYEYLRIENIGDAAVWEHKVNDLIVLLGDYQFTLNVDLIEGKEKNLETARLIATAIIEKACN